MEEKIDILLATYNGEKYVAEQIESILRQTYKNIKIYISDDNSNKNEIKELLEEYEKKSASNIIYKKSTSVDMEEIKQYLLKKGYKTENIKKAMEEE